MAFWSHSRFSSWLSTALHGFISLFNPIATQQLRSSRNSAPQVMVMEAMEIQISNSPSHPSHHIHQIPPLMNPYATGVPLAAAIGMVNLDPAAADDEIFATPLVSPGLITHLSQPEADFLSISIHDQEMQSMEDQHSRTRSWSYKRSVSFSTNSSCFGSAGDGEETRRSNPIASALRENELGKMALTVAVSITTGLLGIKNQASFHPIIVCLIALSLCLGYAATWNGILLRNINISCTCEVANLIEQVGVVLLLMAFFGILGLLFPENLIWVSFLGFGMSLLPFLLPVFKVFDG